MMFLLLGYFSCNFNTDTCNPDVSTVHWKRIKGSTPSVGTGPTGDIEGLLKCTLLAALKLCQRFKLLIF